MRRSGTIIAANKQAKVPPEWAVTLTPAEFEAMAGTAVASDGSKGAGPADPSKARPAVAALPTPSSGVDSSAPEGETGDDGSDGDDSGDSAGNGDGSDAETHDKRDEPAFKRPRAGKADHSALLAEVLSSITTTADELKAALHLQAQRLQALEDKALGGAGGPIPTGAPVSSLLQEAPMPPADGRPDLTLAPAGASDGTARPSPSPELEAFAVRRLCLAVYASAR
jgi:hypothetical protein